ncbi:hypothetical protein JCM10213v2_005404 [Rhodosporidiobolus nylandii]
MAPSAITLKRRLDLGMAGKVATAVLTKSCTSGTLYLLSELVSSSLIARSLTPEERARERVEKPQEGQLQAVLRQYAGAAKLAGYGALVAAPLDHFLYTLLSRAFVGRSGKRWKLAEVVAANALIVPVQNAVYLAVLSVIGGARSARQVLNDVKAGFADVTKITVVVSTLALSCAQRFLPPAAWTPFFSLVGATVDTFINVQEKRRALGEQRKRAEEKDE